MSMWLPETEMILLLHSKVIAQTGGSDGVRELGLIESALARASTSFGGVELYPDIISKAAALGCGLTQNHGFIDGNKRIGMTAMLLVLRRNGIHLQYTQQELVELGLGVACGRVDVADVRAWLLEHQMQS